MDPFHFDTDPDPGPDPDPGRILTKIQSFEMKRIHTDPDPQHWLKARGTYLSN